jgi:hypothetical protein
LSRFSGDSEKKIHFSTSNILEKEQHRKRSNWAESHKKSRFWALKLGVKSQNEPENHETCLEPNSKSVEKFNLWLVHVYNKGMVSVKHLVLLGKDQMELIS